MGTLTWLLLNEVQLADVQEVLGQYRGKPLSNMLRYVGFQRFGFGALVKEKNRKGEIVDVVQWAIVVNCPWVLTGPNAFELTSSHFEPERKDDHAKPFYADLGRHEIIVESISVQLSGKIEIWFGDGHHLSISPEQTQEMSERNPEDFGPEHWRIMTPTDESGGTGVLRYSGLEWWDVDP